MGLREKTRGRDRGTRGDKEDRDRNERRGDREVERKGKTGRGERDGRHLFITGWACVQETCPGVHCVASTYEQGRTA